MTVVVILYFGLKIPTFTGTLVTDGHNRMIIRSYGHEVLRTSLCTNTLMNIHSHNQHYCAYTEIPRVHLPKCTLLHHSQRLFGLVICISVCLTSSHVGNVELCIISIITLQSDAEGLVYVS